MNIDTEILDAHVAYQRILDLPDLCFKDPRFECQARAQIQGEWLYANHVVTGRAWALAPQGSAFIAPLRQENGLPFPFTITDYSEAGSTGRYTLEDHSRPLMWNYHVAAYGETTDGDICVYDPVLFDGPVTFDHWKSLFNDPAIELKHVAWGKAPRHDYYGSPYAPGFQEEHGLDDSLLARLDMSKLSRHCLHAIPHMKHAAPRQEFRLQLRDIARMYYARHTPPYHAPAP